MELDAQDDEDEKYRKIEDVADEHFKELLDEKRDTVVRGVFNHYVQWALREKAKKDNMSAEEYRDRLLMAQNVVRLFHRALHTFGSYDEPEHTRFWTHQPVNFFRAGDESRGLSIDRDELRRVAAIYVSHPEIQNDPLDWYFMDALVFAELDAFAEAVMSGEARGTVNWAWAFARHTDIKYAVYSLLFGILGLAVRYVVAPAVAIYFGLKADYGVAFTVSGIWLLYLIVRLISVPARWKAKRKAGELTRLMVEAYAQLNSAVISPTRLREAINKAATAGIIFDGALFAIIDRAVKRDETAFVFRR